jgi:hypothetical protein
MGLDVYREGPNKYKIYLNRRQVGRLIGYGGRTITFLRKKHDKTNFYVNNTIPNYYLEFSGEDLPVVYKHILRVL